MREEYPRPQFRRKEWLCLNGTWEYCTDRAGSGIDRKFYEDPAVFNERIEVPFCRESRLSGIGDPDFCSCVWYRKQVQLSPDRSMEHKRLLLHIGACDYKTQVWVNGKKAGEHIGGYTPMTFDITDLVVAPEFTVTVCAEDDLRSRLQPCGKQSRKYASHGCSYTRVTGIWQTVWLELVPMAYIRNVKYTPDIVSQCLQIDLEAVGASGMTVRAEAFYRGCPMGEAEAVVTFRGCHMTLPLDQLFLWEAGAGRLYDLVLTMGEDRVESYFGMRSIDAVNGILHLNGKPIFQRLVLDQGYYPDGIYTAPSDRALEEDVRMSMQMGFNGARLHQKIFEPRFLYHCDRLGYLVWGEHASWGLDMSRPEVYESFLPEWMEVLERDFNHPSVIGWCPLNETQADQNVTFVKTLARLTRALDPTRLYIETSGWAHIDGLADILDYHYYEADPEKMKQKLAPLAEGLPIRMDSPYTKSYVNGIPTFISEFGGIRIADGQTSGWGYGAAPQNEEEFFARFGGQVQVLLQNPAIGAFCYTQLYDIEQEQNGLYSYSRIPKFDPEKIRQILSQPAAIEQQ